ncbi:MAG: flagellar hook-basal body complex protein FliE [Planctomycetota bacterium]
MNPIPPVSSVSASGSAGGLAANKQSAKPAEGRNLFEGLIRGTNAEQLSSEQAIQDLVEGRTSNVQQVVLAVAKAEMSFQLFMKIRNQLIESYNELMRMQF